MFLVVNLLTLLTAFLVRIGPGMDRCVFLAKEPMKHLVLSASNGLGLATIFVSIVRMLTKANAQHVVVGNGT